MHDLKTRSEESFGVTRDIRTSLIDVQDLRNSVTEAMKREPTGLVEKLCTDNEAWGSSGIEPYIEPNEQWTKSAEAKTIINTLELEYSKSTFAYNLEGAVVMSCPLLGQQVADLLRDRLQSLGGELVEAKSRIVELETAQAHDRAALVRANDMIRDTSTCFRYQCT